MTLKFQFCLVCSLGDGEEKADGWMDVWKKVGASSLLAAQQPLWGVLMEPEVVGQGRSSWKWVPLF